MSEKEQEKVRQKLREAGDDILSLTEEIIDICILTGDADALDDFLTVLHIFSAYGLVKSIKDQGFGKEFKEFCDKVGRGKK
jgi:DNA repair protein RadC